MTISGTTITINKSGLWHFEGYLYVAIGWTAPPTAQSLYASFTADGVSYVMAQNGILDRNFMIATHAEYVKTLQFSHDVYISAPATIRVFRSISLVAGGATISYRQANGVVSGYLISE